MKHFYLIQIKQQGFDTYDAHIVYADSEAEVRELAANRSADEGPEIWRSSEASVTRLDDMNLMGSRYILSSFNAG